jgi:hypothetical protein
VPVLGFAGTGPGETRRGDVYRDHPEIRARAAATTFDRLIIVTGWLLAAGAALFLVKRESRAFFRKRW